MEYPQHLGKWGDFDVWQISARWYKLLYKTANRAVTMTGSDVTAKLPVAFTFVFVRVHLHHFTSSIGTESTDEIIVTLQRPRGGISNIDYFIDVFYKKADITDAKSIIAFHDMNPEGGIVFEPSTIEILLNSTSTDLIQPIIYLKRLM